MSNIITLLKKVILLLQDNVYGMLATRNFYNIIWRKQKQCSVDDKNTDNISFHFVKQTIH